MPGRPLKLSFLVPGKESQEVLLDRSPFLIGRDESCELCIKLPWMSRRQLVLEQLDGVWTADAVGRNPVLLDSIPLATRAPLTSGARIAVGPILFVFDADGAAQDALPWDQRRCATVTLELSWAVMRTDTISARQRMAMLSELVAQFADLDGPDEVAAACVSAGQKVLRARDVSLLALDGGRTSARIVASSGESPAPPSRSAATRALANARTIVLAPGDGSSNDDERGSVLCAPVAGALVLYAHRDARDTIFDADDAAFASVLAHMLGPAIAAARRHQQARAQNEALLREIALRGRIGAMVATSEPMRRVAAAIERVAATDAIVMIRGETGVGKEVVAREIHARSRRADGPFFAINCAALPETLIESELFGHRRGAFTGADRDRRGLFELAAGGSVFLDEVGELPAAAQAKLLRALDAREILPIGAERPLRIDARLLAATHRDLEAEVEAGRFRRDLYFRLKVFPIVVPPLRERLEDLPALAEHLLGRSEIARTKHLSFISPTAMAALMAHEWPGNVRELAHVLERAAIFADDGDVLGAEHLPDEVVGRAAGEATGEPAALRAAVAEFERGFILRALERNGWNRTLTARELRVSLRAFMEKLRRYGIRPEPS